MVELVAKKLLVLLLIWILFANYYVSADPPASPAIPSLPYFCETTNNGIEVCDDMDNNCDGTIDENLTSISDCLIVGSCTGAIKTCSTGIWSSCSILPQTETCNNIDDNCNGNVDDGCSCQIGTNRSCGSDIGECIAGIQSCVGGVWSDICINEITPQNEICDDVDNNCDGTIDENVCPVSIRRINGGYNSPSKAVSDISDAASDTAPDKAVNSIPINVENPSIVSAKQSSSSDNSTTAKILADDTAGYSKTNMLMIILVIFLIIILGYYRVRNGKTISKNISNMPLGNIKSQQILGQNLNYGMNAQSTLNTRFNLDNNKILAMNYISVMRRRGYDDEAIKNTLRSTGWREEQLNILFK